METQGISIRGRGSHAQISIMGQFRRKLRGPERSFSTAATQGWGGSSSSWLGTLPPQHRQGNVSTGENGRDDRPMARGGTPPSVRGILPTISPGHLSEVSPTVPMAGATAGGKGASPAEDPAERPPAVGHSDDCCRVSPSRQTLDRMPALCVIFPFFDFHNDHK